MNLLIYGVYVICIHLDCHINYCRTACHPARIICGWPSEQSPSLYSTTGEGKVSITKHHKYIHISLYPDKYRYSLFYFFISLSTGADRQHASGGGNVGGQPFNFNVSPPTNVTNVTPPIDFN